MQWLTSRILVLAWAVWLGGLLGIFLAVTTVFAVLDPDRTTAGMIGAVMFGRVERMILLIAAAAIISAIGMTHVRRSTSRVALLATLVLAAALALAGTLLITPRINALRQANLTQTSDFKRLHGASMATYSTQVALLALAGLILPSALNPRTKDPAP